jgi:hypothetical protein
MATKKQAAPPSDLPKLAAPAQCAPANARVTRLSDLTLVTEADITTLHGMGPNATASIKAAMKAKRLSFAKR